MFHFCEYIINGTMAVLSNYRGVQPAFAYNPHLDFEKTLGEKSISDVLSASIKSDFNKV